MTLEERKAVIEVELSEARKVMEDAKNKVLKLANKFAKLQSQIDAVKLEGELDWEWLLKAYPESGIKYNALIASLGKIGLSTSCAWTHTNQRCVNLSLHPKKDFPIKLEGVKTILPFIKPLENGYKSIAIDDNERSSNHTYVLGFRGDEIVLGHCCKDVIKTFKTIEDNPGMCRQKPSPDCSPAYHPTSTRFV